jgi:hypothetical protein
MDKPRVKIEFPKDFSEKCVIKALEATVYRLKNNNNNEHSHESENNIETMEKQNPATRELMSGFKNDFDTMMKSLYTEIGKIL